MAETDARFEEHRNEASRLLGIALDDATSASAIRQSVVQGCRLPPTPWTRSPPRRRPRTCHANRHDRWAVAELVVNPPGKQTKRPV